MANYAFIDEARTRKIYANDDNIMKYKSVRCYCKNPNCDAKMFIYMPEHKNSAYFKASGKPGHQGACGLTPYHFPKVNYVEEEFVFPQGLFPLLNDNGNGQHKGGTGGTSGGKQGEIERRPLRGLKEVYAMLTNTDVSDTYNNYLIRDMIADERTYPYYRNGISGYKVVYEKMKPRIKGKNHDGIVVVFGEWKINTTDAINYVSITSEKQIAVIKKES